MPSNQVNVYFDVELCFRDFQMVKVGDAMFKCFGRSSSGIIPPMYFLYVTQPATGETLWERPPADTTPSGPAPFRFQSQLPVHQRASQPGVSPASNLPQSHLLDEDWADDYANSPEWGTIWHSLWEPDSDWPEGYRIYSGRLYFGETLVVPEDLLYSVIRDYHFQKGHLGVDSLVKAIQKNFLYAPLPPGTTLRSLCSSVKRECYVCQVCEPPNWSTRGRYESTPIPEHPFISVCVDIFSLPTVVWQGTTYDQVILCVDRHSGWMIARPCQKLGLTAEKCAHLLLEGGWGVFGAPSVVTSDQGSQFSGKWFQTMCSRLGIRQSFSQAHRPQANGRAEAAGRQLITRLRKLHAEEGINWVEALPRVLLYLHDMAGEAGLSPHQILFGRERNLAGLPFTPERLCPEAQAHFDHLEEMDKAIARHMNDKHKLEQDRHNSKVKDRMSFRVGDQVWLQKPRQVGGPKIQTWWTGPAQILRRTGANSYIISTPAGTELDVHLSQLKPYEEDFLQPGGVPLHHFQTGSKIPPPTPEVEFICGHSSNQNPWQFLVHWLDSPPQRRFLGKSY